MSSIDLLAVVIVLCHSCVSKPNVKRSGILAYLHDLYTREAEMVLFQFLSITPYVCLSQRLQMYFCALYTGKREHHLQ